MFSRSQENAFCSVSAAEVIYITKRNSIKNGSITVEASFVFPIFFFAVVMFLYFFQFMKVYLEVQRALLQTASFCSQYAYFTEEFQKGEENESNEEKESLAYTGDFSEFAEGIFDLELVNWKFHSCMKKNILNSSCVDTVTGFSLIRSEFLEQGTKIDLLVDYKVKFPVPVFCNISFDVVQEAKTKAFLGKSMQEKASDAEQEDTIVYIAETGSVYHKTNQCTYLKPSIRQVEMTDLKTLRNQNGAIYTFCDSCCNEKELYTAVYVTTWGLSYHSRVSCSGLKRTIREETLEEAEKQGYRACSKCAKEV